ncbi:hypothetical protein D3C85_1655880 [compost metagenome]
MKADKGIWVHNSGADTTELPNLSYYQRVYNNSYTKPLAVLEIITNDSLLRNFLKAVDVNQNMQVLIAQGGDTVYHSGGIGLYDEEMANLLAMAEESN